METTKFFFEVAAFDPSGLLIGTSRRRLSDLSDKWLAIATAYLTRHGGNFSANWGGPLSHLATQLTSSDGVGLVTFSADSVLVASFALLSGMNRDTELSVLKMFVNSLRKTEMVQASAANETPFDDMLQLTTRPLMVVIPWGDERVTEQNDELVQELALHFAAAYFQEQIGGRSDP